MILLTGRGCLVRGVVHGPGGVVHGPGGMVSGGVPGPGGCAWSWVGGCLVLGGGVPGPGWQGAWSSGGCLVENPPETATAAGGTHPTGMHSCW